MNMSSLYAVLRHELRVLGAPLFAIPLVAALGFVSLAAVLSVRNVHHDFLVPFVAAILEACLPLAAGVLLATVAPRDAALELQLTLPTPYRFTAARRFALLLCWTVLVEAMAALAFHLSLPWTQSKHGADYVLLWLAPTMWLGASGTLLALLLRSRATAGALLGTIWIAQLTFHGYFAHYSWTRPWFLFATVFTPTGSYWLANRVELMLTAVALALGVWIFLLNCEWRFRAEDV